MLIGHEQTTEILINLCNLIIKQSDDKSIYKQQCSHQSDYMSIAETQSSSTLSQSLLPSQTSTPFETLSPAEAFSQNFFISRYNELIRAYNKYITQTDQISEEISISADIKDTYSNAENLKTTNQMKNESIGDRNTYKDINNTKSEDATMHRMMQQLQMNAEMYKLWVLTSKKTVMLIIVLIMLVIPIINIFLLAGLFLQFFYLLREYLRHLSNRKINNDPLSLFVYLPDTCHQLGKHHASLCLTPSQLQGFTFNDNFNANGKKTLNKQDGNIVIYDHWFEEAWSLPGRQMIKVGVSVLVGCGLVAANVLILAKINGFW